MANVGQADRSDNSYGAEKMTEITIKDIQIFPVRPQNGLIAFVSFILNDSIYVGNVGLHTSLSNPLGFRLVYPIKELPNGQEIGCVHPITKTAGLTITKAVIEKYQAIRAKAKSNQDINKGVFIEEVENEYQKRI